MGTITVYYHTHRGLVRNKNEDGILANKRLVTNTDMDAPVCLTESMDHHLLVVADGMGGHGNGSLASEIVLRTFVNGTGTPVLGRTRLLEVIYKAKTNLDHAVNMDRVLFDMRDRLRSRWDERSRSRRLRAAYLFQAGGQGGDR